MNTPCEQHHANPHGGELAFDILMVSHFDVRCIAAIVGTDSGLNREGVVIVCIVHCAAQMDLPSRSGTLVESVDDNLPRLCFLERNFGGTVGVGAACTGRVKNQ